MSNRTCPHCGETDPRRIHAVANDRQQFNCCLLVTAGVGCDTCGTLWQAYEHTRCNLPDMIFDAHIRNKHIDGEDPA